MSVRKRSLSSISSVWCGSFGLNGPDIDAELIMLTARLWRELGIEQFTTLQLNTLGLPQSERLIVMHWLCSWNNTKMHLMKKVNVGCTLIHCVYWIQKPAGARNFAARANIDGLFR